MSVSILDMSDDDVCDAACAAGILLDLEEKWIDSHADTIAETLRDYGFGNYAAAGRKLNDACKEWVAKRARERFADGLELPGYCSDGEDEVCAA